MASEVQQPEYSTFNKHAATALVCLTAELGVADCVFGRVGQGIAKSVLFMVFYVLDFIGVVRGSMPLIILAMLIFLGIEIVATVDSYRIFCADSVEQAFKDRKGRIVRGCKWGLTLAIPRTICCVCFISMIILMLFAR